MSQQRLWINAKGFGVDVLYALKWDPVIPFQGISVRLEFAHSGALVAFVPCIHASCSL